MTNIFQPVRVRNIELKNRLVRSATAERMVDKEGAVTDELVKCYQKLARGGIGTIITGHSFVREDGRSGYQMMGIHKDDLIPGLKRLTKIAHQYDTRIFIQLNHCGRYAPGSIIGKNPLAVSVIEPPAGVYPPKEMSETEIKEVIRSFGEAAGRAQEAGFDGVQIHSAHGYLASQFLSPHTNRRQDNWGGHPENRSRFVLEVLKSIRHKVGPAFPIWIKVNCEDFVEGGLNITESIAHARRLEQNGVDAIEISGGVEFRMVIRIQEAFKDKEAYFLPQAESFRAHLNIPLILVGGIRSLATMEMLIKDKGFDLVSLSRPLIREPDLPIKLQKKTATKAACISCNACLLGKKDEPIRCRAEEKIRFRFR